MLKHAPKTFEPFPSYRDFLIALFSDCWRVQRRLHQQVRPLRRSQEKDCQRYPTMKEEGQPKMMKHWDCWVGAQSHLVLLLCKTPSQILRPCFLVSILWRLKVAWTFEPIDLSFSIWKMSYRWRWHLFSNKTSGPIRQVATFFTPYNALISVFCLHRWCC